MIPMKPVNNPNTVPSGMTDEESAMYWESHEISQDFLVRARPLDNSELPPIRSESKAITLRLGTDLLQRLQELARKKHTSSHALLKQFIIERLVEEENLIQD